MTNPEIIYFELNNWARGKDYPDAEPFISWIGNDSKISFSNDKWVKENKLCVVESMIDMSSNFCITAIKEWVEVNCPELLTKYREFLRFSDEDEDVYGQWGNHFKEWSEDNIGLYYEYYEKNQWIEWIEE